MRGHCFKDLPGGEKWTAYAERYNARSVRGELSLGQTYGTEWSGTVLVCTEPASFPRRSGSAKFSRFRIIAPTKPEPHEKLRWLIKNEKTLIKGQKGRHAIEWVTWETGHIK